MTVASVRPLSRRTFTWNDRTLAYQVYGAGERWVVLLHGLLIDSRVNRGLARSLASHGHKVVLLDLLGHGASDKPVHAAEYRMDVYAEQVVALLDEIGAERAVVGGMSLGANVTLHVAARHPERVQGLLLEMPVLERAVPAAALTFVPALLAMHYARPVARALGRLVTRLGGDRDDALGGLLGPVVSPPEATTAVLHGILVGPTVPTVDDRRSIAAPTLVLGHHADFIHPFSDAEAVTRHIPDARLVQAASIVSLRLGHPRLLDEIDRFLTDVWDTGSHELAAEG